MCSIEELSKVIRTNSDSALLYDTAKGVWEGSTTAVTIQMKLNGRLKGELNKYGLTIESVFITDSDMRHIKGQHGSNEERRGQET